MTRATGLQISISDFCFGRTDHIPLRQTVKTFSFVCSLPCLTSLYICLLEVSVDDILSLL